MTFLGIGPGELFLIFIIALVVVGPERLPGFARQMGKAVVGLRNWVQRSPDAQMLLRARDELELELRTIRQDLTQEMESVRTEMQTVRQELLEASQDATRALDEAEQATKVAHDAIETAQGVEESIEQIVEQVPALHVDEIASEHTVEALKTTQLAESLPDLDETVDSINTIAPPELSPPRTIAPPEIYTPANTLPNNGQTVARSQKPGQALAQRLQEESQAADKAAIQKLQSEVSELKQQIQEMLVMVQGLQDSGAVGGETLDTRH